MRRGRVCVSRHMRSRRAKVDPGKIHAKIVQYPGRVGLPRFLQQPITAESSLGNENKHKEGGDAQTGTTAAGTATSTGVRWSHVSRLSWIANKTHPSC